MNNKTPLSQPQKKTLFYHLNLILMQNKVLLKKWTRNNIFTRRNGQKHVQPPNPRCCHVAAAPRCPNAHGSEIFPTGSAPRRWSRARRHARFLPRSFLLPLTLMRSRSTIFWRRPSFAGKTQCRCRDVHGVLDRLVVEILILSSTGVFYRNLNLLFGWKLRALISHQSFFRNLVIPWLFFISL